jgi:hypothetical protein
MKDYAVIWFHDDSDHYNVEWFDTLKAAAEYRRQIFDRHTFVKDGCGVWLAYCPMALLSLGDEMISIKIPGLVTTDV